MQELGERPLSKEEADDFVALAGADQFHYEKFLAFMKSHIELPPRVKKKSGPP